MTASDNFDMSKILKTFFEESRELLGDMETALLEIEKGDYSGDNINAVFRAAHTIKGSAGMFSFTLLERFTHLFENYLVEVRNGNRTVDGEGASLMIKCSDMIHFLLDHYEKEGGGEPGEKEKKGYDLLCGELDRLVGSGSASVVEVDNEPEREYSTDDEIVCNECWHISIRFHGDTFRFGIDPQALIYYMERKGKIVRLKTIYSSIPRLEEMNPETCYLGLEIDFQSDLDKKAIGDIFEFINYDSDVSILPPRGKYKEYRQFLENLPEDTVLIGEMLKEIGTLTEFELDKIVNLRMESMNDADPVVKNKPIGVIAVENNMVQKDVVDAALEKQKSVRKTGSLRIDADKLDTLINTIGELVITGANMNELTAREKIDRNELFLTSSNLNRLIEDIRERIMTLRMVQIGETFKKFQRIVRDLSREQGKEIDLIIRGGDTELDKTLTDLISDPLVHIIRNAVDHGISTPERRIEEGKSRRGTITLSAHHESGNVVIEISDDGNGLNKDKIRKKAIELGMVQPDQIIADSELYQFMFEPGFSTAEKITTISGRGVGMDVVRRNVDSLRGTINIDSREGEGTVFRINLPLTLAIIDGFLFKVNGQFYIVPLNQVVECAEVHRENIDVMNKSHLLNLRGDALPYLKLRDFFRISGEEPAISNMVIVEYLGEKTGLIADELVGEFQTVIKPMGALFGKCTWISGATILGSGDVAFILDIVRLIEIYNKNGTDARMNKAGQTV